MQYNAKAVASATSVGVSTLRNWERRYGVPKPRRSPTGARLYTDRELAQVRQMAKLLEAGMTASHAAKAARQTRHNRPARGIENFGDAYSSGSPLSERLNQHLRPRSP